MRMRNVYHFEDAECGVTFASEVHFRSTTPGREHTHPQVQVLVALGGRLAVGIPDRRIVAMPGQAVVLPAGIPHAVPSAEEVEGGKEWRCELIDLRFTVGTPPAETAAGLGGLTLLRAGTGDGTDEGALATVARDLRDAAGGDRPRALAMACVWRLLSLLGPPSPHRASGHAAVARAENYMQKHLARPLPVAELARHVRLSRSQLTRLFEQSTGTGPATRLRRLRIQRAADLLAVSDLSVKEIAAACGFVSPNHLTRVFREVMGATPTQHRTTAAARAVGG